MATPCQVGTQRKGSTKGLKRRCCKQSSVTPTQGVTNTILHMSEELGVLPIYRCNVLIAFNTVSDFVKLLAKASG